MRTIGNKLVLGTGFALALAVGSQQANADLIFQESFEGALQSETSIINGGIRREGDFWTVVTPSTPVDINYPVGNIDGDSYFGGRDFGGPFGGGVPRAVEFQDIDISLYENITLTISLSNRTVGGLHSDSHYESNDTLRIGEDVDGDGLDILDEFAGNGAVGGGLLNGDNVELTQNLVDFVYDITNGDNLTIRIDVGELDVDQFGGNEEAIALDNIRIEGDLIVASSGGGSGGSGGNGGGSSIPEPASLALFGLGLTGLGFMRRRRNA